MSDKHRVLYVEDDPIIAEIVTRILLANGYDLWHASNRADAEALAAENSFCCAVVDLTIPADSESGSTVDAGFDLIQRLRQRRPDRSAAGAHEFQIILFSGWADRVQYVRRARELGCDDFVFKNVRPSESLLPWAIECALMRSGRVDHAVCESKTDLAATEIKRPFTIAYVWYESGEGDVEYVRARSAAAAVAAMEAKPNTEGNLFVAAVFEGVINPVPDKPAPTANHVANTTLPTGRYIVSVVHRELAHYAVEAASKREAIDKAKVCWIEQRNEVRLGSEFADIERIYVDEDDDAEAELKGNDQPS